MLAPSRQATVEESDEDEGPGHVGGTLDPDEDVIMELVSDAENEEEDEDVEISKSTYKIV
jgi:hypothetical protein